ncbi:MAG: LytTR family transcriptional regulator DNA-binding domain-containing protein [Saprospiraceae bacterium]|nr:LytTR family transcriptional regulator DNA-binding domain-containing protein [Saprospiraceae bacterium]
MEASKISVLIVEDDPIIASDISHYMKDFGYSPFPAVSSAADALLLMENIIPDFILIDVSLDGDMDGIELAEKINQDYDIPILFLTAHHDRQTLDRIKATHPSAYLVKPLQVHNLQTSIELALYNHSHKKLVSKPQDTEMENFISGDHFFIKIKNQLRKILLEDIHALEAYDNYSFAHTKTGQKHIVGSTLKALELKLNEYQFVRIHRSFIVNLKAIESIEDDIVMIRDLKIPIGKTYKEEFMKRIQLL